MQREGTCAIGRHGEGAAAGRAKTRLCPPLQPAQAAALSAAFLRDITENIALASRARADRMAASPMRRPGPRAGSTDILPMGPGLCWPTDRRRCRRMSRASAAACCTRRRRCSARASRAVCLVNSDSPTLPTAVPAPGGARAADARRAGRAWPGGRWRLLPVGHEAAARAPVRRHRLEHRQCRGSDAGAGGRAWPGCGHAADVVRRG